MSSVRPRSSGGNDGRADCRAPRQCRVPVRLLDLTARCRDAGLEACNRAQARSVLHAGRPGADLDRRVRSRSRESRRGRLDRRSRRRAAEVKRALLEKVDAVRRPGTIVSSNTSGIPIASLAEGRSEDFRRHWLGTHFFNPPRYLRLLEIIPTGETSKTVVEQMSWFADHRLGKGVVIAKDTPNFIGNRIGLFGVMGILRALESGEFTIEDIDAMTGPALGRPRSATFRTMDIAGSTCWRTSRET